MANQGKGVTITSDRTSVTIAWSEFRDGPGLKAVPAVVIALPFAAIATMAVPGLACAGIGLFLMVMIAVAMIAAIMVGGRTEAHLGSWGLEWRTFRSGVRLKRRFVPLPIVVRVEPLWGSADQLSPNDPTEWGVAFIGPGGFAEGILTLDKAGVGTLRQTLAQAAIPGVTYDEIGDKENRLSTACQGCGYDLVGLTEPRCPECGTPVSEATMELVRRIHAERRAAADRQA